LSSLWLIREIATVPEPASCIGSRNSGKGILKSLLESFASSGTNAAQDCLHFGKSLFNGRKVWRIRRQKEHLASTSFDKLSHLFLL
jgi:hypothetical protein